MVDYQNQKQIATRANRYVKPEQVQDVAVVVQRFLETMETRDNRKKTKLELDTFLNDWGN